MRVCSLLQLDTVEGIVLSLLPLRLSSSSSSSLLSLLKTHKHDSENASELNKHDTYIKHVIKL